MVLHRCRDGPIHLINASVVRRLLLVQIQTFLARRALDRRGGTRWGRHVDLVQHYQVVHLVAADLPDLPQLFVAGGRILGNLLAARRLLLAIVLAGRFERGKYGIHFHPATCTITQNTEIINRIKSHLRSL